MRFKPTYVFKSPKAISIFYGNVMTHKADFFEEPKKYKIPSSLNVLR